MELQKQCLPPSPPGGAPWLVYQHDGHRNTQLFGTIWPENKSYLKAIPELQSKVVYASSYGWLLLDHGSRTFSLWNPMTLETIPLPRLKHRFNADFDRGLNGKCVLTSSPDNDDNFAVFMFSEHSTFSCRPNDENPRWRVDEIVFQGRRGSVHNVISCNGLIYAWGSFHDENDQYVESLVTIKTSVSSSQPISVTWLQMRTPNCIHRGGNGQMGHTVESCGQVYHITGVHNHGRLSAIDVWALDLEQKKWVEVESLDNRTFFLKTNSSTWCWGSDQVEGNSIFLTPNRDDPVNNVLYSYNLEDRSFTTYLPEPKSCTSWRQPF